MGQVPDHESGVQFMFSYLRAKAHINKCGRAGKSKGWDRMFNKY